MTDQHKHSHAWGFDRGYSIASDQQCRYPMDTSYPEWRKSFYGESYEAENNNRQDPPFESTAHEINQAEDSEGNWNAFDEGITDGIMQYLEDNWPDEVPTT